MNKKLLFLLFPVAAFAQSAQDETLAKQLASQEMTLTAHPQTPEALVCSADLPYNENFEDVTIPEIPACATIVNAGSGNNFATAQTGYGFNSKTLRYRWNTQNAANAWFFTRSLYLTAGSTYAISYKYGSAGSSLYTEKLKVHVGTDATVAGMDATPLVDHPLVNNNVTPLTDNLTFTPTTTGLYFVGFHCYSLANMFDLYIDDISVTATSLGVSELSADAFKVYPNPAKDFVKVSSGEKIKSVEVLNMLGQSVSRSTVNATDAEISLVSLPKGAYFLRAEGEKSSKTIRILKD